MRKCFITVTMSLFFLIFIISTGFCYNTKRIKNTAIACKEKLDMEEILELTGDLKVLDKAIKLKVVTNRCIVINGPQEVFITDTEFWNGMYQIRKKGDPFKYWTYEGALSK